MRRLLLSTAAGLLLTPLVGLGLANGSDKPPKAPPSKPADPAQPSPFVDKDKGDEAGCGTHGTQVRFVDTPKDAAAKAKKEEKLVFVLHVSGNFEDPRFT
jgi:hypothetical protein